MHHECIIVGRRRRSRQRGTFISALYVKILRCAQSPKPRSSKSTEALHYPVSDPRLPSEHNLAAVFITT